MAAGGIRDGPDVPQTPHDQRGPGRGDNEGPRSAHTIIIRGFAGAEANSEGQGKILNKEANEIWMPLSCMSEPNTDCESYYCDDLVYHFCYCFSMQETFLFRVRGYCRPDA